MANPSLLFAYRLARDLGMTVAELGARMSCAEFMRWALFLEIENVDIPEQRKKEQAQRDLNNKMMSAFSKLGGA